MSESLLREFIEKVIIPKNNLITEDDDEHNIGPGVLHKFLEKRIFHPGPIVWPKSSYRVEKGQLTIEDGKPIVPIDHEQPNVRGLTEKELFLHIANSGTSARNIGLGEAALYWLFGGTPNAIQPKRDDRSDLELDGKPVEVKSYTHHDKLKIGRVTAWYKSAEHGKIATAVGMGSGSGMGITIFDQKLDGIAEQYKNKLLGPTSPYGIAGHFMIDPSKNKELYELVLKLIDSIQWVPHLRTLLEEGDRLGLITRNYTIDEVLNARGEEGEARLIQTAKDLAEITMKSLMMWKLGKKPGDGNFICNLKRSDRSDVKMFEVRLNMIKAASYKNLKHAWMSQEALMVNTRQFFIS